MILKALVKDNLQQNVNYLKVFKVRGNNIGSGYLKVIKTNYPDLNMDWLLYDEGPMIKKAIEKESDYAFSYELEVEEHTFKDPENSYSNDIIDLHKKLIATQEKTELQPSKN